MSKLQVVNILVGIVIGILVVVFAGLTYFSDKPKIKATGEYSNWTIPSMVSEEDHRLMPNSDDFSTTTRFFVEGVNSYLRLDIRNEGDASAKEIRILLPIDGIYVIDDTKESKNFDEVIEIEDLHPSEGKIVEIWSKGYRGIDNGDVVVTHTRGTTNVDFGYRVSGSQAWIARNFWLLVTFAPLVVWLISISYLTYQDRKKQIKI